MFIVKVTQFVVIKLYRVVCVMSLVGVRLIVRRPVSPKAHQSEGPLVRRPIIPKAH